jgi:hypothetical protein
MLPLTGIQAFVKRVWLNPEESLHTSYILAHVEDSQGGANKCGSNIVLIADCRRVIQLEFFLGTQEARDASITKLNLIIAVLGEFGRAILNEAAKMEKEITTGNPSGLSLVREEN